LGAGHNSLLCRDKTCNVFDQIITSLVKKKNMTTYSCRRYLYFWIYSEFQK